MKIKSSKGYAAGLLLKSGVSLLALTALGVTVAGSAMAQTQTDTAASTAADKKSDTQEVVVVGVRRSLKSAQQIKRDADTIVDSITATDIGAFPDKSVAEALQRVAGITVSRFAATGDTAHFSAEPSGVLVRGLPQVRSEFNGRDTFSANSSRGLSWGDVSPELMAGVDTYKNQTADLIEGGISGSINLRTRTPFDSKGQLIALSADASYGDLAKKLTPDVSGIYSNRWDTSIGEFGVMVNYAYSKVETLSQGAQFGRIGIFQQSVFNTPVTASDPLGRAYIPTSIAYHNNLYTRTRNGMALAGQWQNHDHTMVATLQYNESKYQNNWAENTVSASAFGMWQVVPSNVYSDPYIVEPAAGTSFTFDKNGFFQTGTMTSKFAGQTAQIGFGSNDKGQPFFTGCANWSGPSDGTCGRQAASVGTSGRYATTTEDTKDTSFNFKWDPTQKLHLNFDLQYVKATVDNYDIESDTNSKANAYFDFTGNVPTVKLTTPTAATNFAASAGGLSNPQNYAYNDISDHAETSKGHEFATRLDAQYNFDNGSWLDSLKVGVRYADREQEINWSTYNWAGIESNWAGNASQTTCYSISSSCYPKEYETKTFGTDVLGGGKVTNDSGNQFVFTQIDKIKDRKSFAAAMNATKLGFSGWTPLCLRSADITGTCYLHQEHNTVSEKTFAGYTMLKFGGHDKTFAGIPVSGNIGLRWVETRDASTGFVTFPTALWYSTQHCTSGGAVPQPLDRQLGCFVGTPAYPADNTTTPPTPAQPAVAPNPSATNLLAAVAFSNGAGSPLTTIKTHINILPSFNIKFNLTDHWVLRLAASRAMSRPDMGFLKNYVAIGNPSVDLTPTGCAQTTPSRCIKNSAGVNTDYTPLFTASAGNPTLKSTTADQFDVSLEDYFASVGSFTFDAFYKKFDNYIQYGSYLSSYTNNGVTEQVKVNGPINGQGASVKGFEVAYQRFFDFLPAPFDGFGVQANYTHLVNTGIVNPNLSTVSGDGGTNTGSGGIAQATTAIDPHALEGLSDDSYNLVFMYEKGPWAARMAYNWRSKYLVSAADCCVGLPVWQKQSGYLDASVRYKVSNNTEVSLEGSNLLGTDTVLQEQVEGDIPGITPNAKRVFMPDGRFAQDRRVQLGVRLKY